MICDKMTKIITDLDDVLVKAMPAFVNWLSRQIGKRISINDLLSTNPEEFFLKYGISLNYALVDAKKEFFSNERNLEKLEPYKANLDELDCSIVTGREDKTRDITRYWLRKKFRFDGTLYTTDWDANKKASYVLQNSPNLYIDDNAQILAEIRVRDIERRTLLCLVTRPWNQHGTLRAIDDESFIKRVKGFQKAVYQGV